MSTLSPKERAIVDAARKGWGPSASATRSVREGVAAKLHADPTFGMDAPGPARVTSRATRLVASKAVLGMAAGLAVVGLSAAIFVKRETPAPRPRPSVEMPLPSEEPPRAPATVIATVSIDSLPNAVPEVPKATTPVGTARPAASGRTNDDIAEEVALVGAAQKSLRDGSPEDALATLARHASRFPSGALREERIAIQVLALCALGDLPRARTLRAELERISPSSSHRQRLSCASP